MNEIDIGKDINNHTLEFSMSPNLWGNFDANISIYRLNEVKFLNEAGDDLNSDMNSIPNNKGGIYFFYIKSGVIPKNGYLVYIGRALSTESQNLRARCKSYFYKYPKERPKINRMIHEWGPFLYIKYLELEDNDLIKNVEDKLINSFIPPFNDKIPDKTIHRAVKAF